MTKITKPTRVDLTEAARDLYMAPRPDGSHAHSLRDIEALLRQRWPKQTIPVASTIMRWAREHGWEALFREGIEAGAAAAVLEAMPVTPAVLVDERSHDEAMRDAIARQRHEAWRMANDMKRKAYEFIMANDFASMREAIAAFSAAEAVTKTERVEVSVGLAHEDRLGHLR